LLLLFVFVVRLGALATLTAPLALQAPRTSNAASASALQRPSDVVFNEKREAARPSLSFLFLFLFLLVFCFRSRGSKPTSPTRRLEPSRREESKKAAGPSPILARS
jgi:Na+-transporting methylmalonyl-CoA/oxaloacetate decarboxylase gamma subunit